LRRAHRNLTLREGALQYHRLSSAFEEAAYSGGEHGEADFDRGLRAA
jgi:hypothetical protein